MEANRLAFRRYALRPSVLTGVSTIDLSTRMLDSDVHAPFYVSPMAYHREVHPDGEAGVARATAAAGVTNVVSTLSSDALEEVAARGGSGTRWFQLYLQPDFSVTRRLVERAERAGYRAVVLTADVPLLAVRDRQARGGFAIDRSVPIGNGSDVVPPARTPTGAMPRYHLREDAAATWEILDRLRKATRLPVVVKGILSAEDARRAVEHGARGIVVSNHGGRQLDGAIASLDALPEVVRAVGRRAEVYMDGGVRRGSDIVTALALGARAVGIGRPVLWALAVGGEQGVAQYLETLGLELANTLALCGRSSVAEVDASLVDAGSSSPRSPRPRRTSRGST